MATTPDALDVSHVHIHTVEELLLLVIAYCLVVGLPAGAPKTALTTMLSTLVANAVPWGSQQ